MNDKKDIGALWERQSKNGLSYLTGFVEVDGKKHEIVLFKNKKDGVDKRPDWRIYPSEKREGGSDIPF